LVLLLSNWLQQVNKHKGVYIHYIFFIHYLISSIPCIRHILKNQLVATHPEHFEKSLKCNASGAFWKINQMQRIRGILKNHLVATHPANFEKSIKCNASEPSNEKVGSNATHPGHLFEKITQMQRIRAI